MKRSQVLYAAAMMVLRLLVCVPSVVVVAFPTATRSAAKTAPTWDKTTNKWIQSPNDDGVYPYDAVGSLLRHGPSPFFKRLTDPAGYEQDVLGYMAKAKVSRAEATGNMDARAENAADWTYQKMKEKNGAPVVDYTALDSKKAALTTVWALGITPLGIYVVAKTLSEVLD